MYACNGKVGQSQCMPKVCPPFDVDKNQGVVYFDVRADLYQFFYYYKKNRRQELKEFITYSHMEALILRAPPCGDLCHSML